MAMINEDFVKIKLIMKQEKEAKESKHATLQEVARLESDIRGIGELKRKVGYLEPDVLQLTRQLDERVKKLNSDFLEAGLTAVNDLASISGKRDEMQRVLQLKKEQLQT